MDHHEILIVGGGNAGISLAARLLRRGARDVAVVESETVHRYRPLLNYVGSGTATMSALERPASSVMPRGVAWVRARVASVDPAEPSVTTTDGTRLTSTTLVLCPGMEEDWEATPGLAEAGAEGWATSTFTVEGAPRVWPALRGLTSGRVVFTVPPEPAPCGPTALKPLMMACDHWSRAGVLDDLEVHLVLPGATPVGLEQADRLVERSLATYGAQVHREAVVREVGDRRVVLSTGDGERVLDDLAFAHVVPHYRAPGWVGESGLVGGDPAGRVDVDPHTMRHPRHPSVWALGDVADLGTRPSGGALRKQVEVLADNILAGDARPPRRYDGYTVVPVTVSRRRALLAEVDRAGRPTPTVPFPDLVRPRLITWLADRYALPMTYFHRILRGKV